MVQCHPEKFYYPQTGKLSLRLCGSREAENITVLGTHVYECYKRLKSHLAKSENYDRS